MPKFNYHGPMPEDQTTAPNNSRRRTLLHEVCDALAVRFGWDDFDHYHRNNYHHAKEIKNTVYHMSASEKMETLNNCRDHKVGE